MEGIGNCTKIKDDDNNASFFSPTIPIFLFLCFFTFIFNDAIINEDHVWMTWFASHNYNAIWSNVSYSNTPINFFPFSLLSIFGDSIFPSRIIAFVSLFVASCAIRGIALHTGRVTPWEATAIAVLAAAVPGDMVLFMPSLINYVIFYGVFLLASYLAINATATGRDNPYMKTIVFILFFSSFTMNSLLVYYASFVIAHFFVWTLRKNTNSIKSMTIKYTAEHVYLICIPALFWVVKSTHIHSKVVSQEYNVFIKKISEIAPSLHYYYSHIVSIIFTPLSIALLLAFLAPQIQRWIKPETLAPQGPEQPRTLVFDAGLIGYGMVTMLCGIIPYIMVGKSPLNDYAHWFTRHMILVQLPAAILIVGVMRLVASLCRMGWRGRSIHFSGKLAIALCFVYFTMVRAKAALEYQFWGMQDQALSRVLREDPVLRDASIYGVATELKNYTYDGKPDYVWMHFFANVYGPGPWRFYFPLPPKRPDSEYGAPVDTQTIQTYLVPEVTNLPEEGHTFDLNRAVTLVLTRPPLRSPDWVLALQYWRYRLLAPDRVGAFVDGMLHVRVIPRNPPPA